MFNTVSPVIQLPAAQIPPKIQAALSFISFCEHITGQQTHTVAGGTERIGRALTGAERRCYDAALTTLTAYFNSDEGDLDRPPLPPGGNAPVPVEPKTPVLV